jgi:hypothetical protein
MIHFSFCCALRKHGTDRPRRHLMILAGITDTEDEPMLASIEIGT